MVDWITKVVVVTGASSGIGAAVAATLVKKGSTVIGLARRKDRVLQLAAELKEYPGKLHAYECDLAIEENIIAAFHLIEENFGGIDVLINNAGVLRASTLTEGDIRDWKQTFDVNVLALCICTKEATRLMKDREWGHVININSIAGHRIPNVIPIFLNVYPASKYAVRAISDTLRAECVATGKKIKVTNLSPGSVATEIGRQENIELSEMDIQKLLPHTATLQAQDVADAVLYALETPRNVEIRELTVQAFGEIL